MCGTTRDGGYVAKSWTDVSAAGLPKPIPYFGYRGEASWIGYSMIHGRWFWAPRDRGADPVHAPDRPVGGRHVHGPDAALREHGPAQAGRRDPGPAGGQPLAPGRLGHAGCRRARGTDRLIRGPAAAWDQRGCIRRAAHP